MFSLELKLGRNNNIDIGFAYYFQPSVGQYTAAFALALTIPINPKDKWHNHKNHLLVIPSQKILDKMGPIDF